MTQTQREPENALRIALLEVLAAHANDNHRPKAFYIADRAVNHPNPEPQLYTNALREILSTHANDNHRPKAFYIADKALN